MTGVPRSARVTPVWTPYLKEEQFMRRLLLALSLLSAAGAAAQSGPVQPAKTPPGSAVPPAVSKAFERRIESHLRKLYAWGPAFQVKVGPLTDAPVTGFYQVPVQVTMGEQSDSAVVYVSKDGRYLLRGDIEDLSTDPLAATRNQIRLSDERPGQCAGGRC